MTGADNTQDLITAWRTVFQNEMKAAGKAWVLFKHGTVVLVGNLQSVEAVTEQARQIMQQAGPVYPGTEHGDFNVSAKDSIGAGVRGEG